MPWHSRPCLTCCVCGSLRDAVGGAAERAAGGAGAVARPRGGVPRQDAAGGTHLPPHTARTTSLAPPAAAAARTRGQHLSTSTSASFPTSVDGMVSKLRIGFTTDEPRTTYAVFFM